MTSSACGFTVRTLIRLTAAAVFTLSGAVSVFAGDLSQCASSPCTSGTTLSTLDFSSYYPSSSAPQANFTTADNALTWSGGPGTFQTMLAGTDYVGTAFPNGTYLLIAGTSGGSGYGSPVNLTFSNPVTEFGVSIEDFYAGFGTSQNYSIQVSAYDGSVLLGQFLVDGSNDGTGVGSLALTAAQTSGGYDITNLIFDDVANGTGSNNLVFGPVSYQNGPPIPSVPEGGSTLAYMVLAMGSCLAAIKLANRKVTPQRL